MLYPGRYGLVFDGQKISQNLLLPVMKKSAIPGKTTVPQSPTSVRQSSAPSPQSAAPQNTTAPQSPAPASQSTTTAPHSSAPAKEIKKTSSATAVSKSAPNAQTKSPSPNPTQVKATANNFELKSETPEKSVARTPSKTKISSSIATTDQSDRSPNKTKSSKTNIASQNKYSVSSTIATIEKNEQTPSKSQAATPSKKESKKGILHEDESVEHVVYSRNVDTSTGTSTPIELPTVESSNLEVFATTQAIEMPPDVMKRLIVRRSTLPTNKPGKGRGSQS